MILADSSVWIDYFRGTKSPQADALHMLLAQERVAIGDLILTEVLHGFDTDRSYALAHDALLALPVIVLGGRETALRAAVHFRALRRRGITVRGTIDTIIATRCIEDGLPLLFKDRDFASFVQHLGLIDVMDALES